MDSKTEHLKHILISDSNCADSHIAQINNSDYSDNTKSILTGYFTNRKELNNAILSDIENNCLTIKKLENVDTAM